MSKSKFLPILAGAAALAVLAMANDASAVTLTLSAQINDNSVGPQSTSNPCIIAGTQCQQPAFMGFNNFTSAGNIASFNMFSTTPTATVADGVQGTPYTVSQLRQADTLGQNQFVVAIDVNSTQAAGETLQLFQVIVNGVVRDTFTGPASIAPGNNGNGFADYTLSPISLVGLAPTDTVLFHAFWNNASDGAESFFLVSVPSPLIGHGLLALLAIGGVLFGGKFLESLKQRHLHAA
jgi:hypothetical protein